VRGEQEHVARMFLGIADDRRQEGRVLFYWPGGSSCTGRKWHMAVCLAFLVGLTVALSMILPKPEEPPKCNPKTGKGCSGRWRGGSVSAERGARLGP